MHVPCYIATSLEYVNCTQEHVRWNIIHCDELLLEFVVLKQNRWQGYFSGGAMWAHEYEIHSHFFCLQELKTVAHNLQGAIDN